MPIGSGNMKPEYDYRLANEDLAPLRKQKWSSYNIFAFWMSDVHSVGGYVTAGSLFALGIASWQVLVSLVVGIVIVQYFANLVAKPSQKTGVPYPVVNRAIFGIRGANIPAIIRGLIAIAWYGVQTFLAAEALNIIFLKFIPGSEALLESSFLGLSTLGWISYAILWVAQAALFWGGMEVIRRFIDFAGPAVYVVMILLAIYLVSKAGWENISFTLSEGEPLGFWASIPVMFTAIAIVVSYFSGPMLNFGDFARYGKVIQSRQARQLLGAAGQLPLLLAPDGHHRFRDRPGVRRAHHRPDPDGGAHRLVVRHPPGRSDVRHGDGRHQHRRQLHLARIRLLERRTAQDLVADGRNDRGRRLRHPHPVELVLERHRHPLLPRRARRSHRTAVRHPDRGLLRLRAPAHQDRRHVHDEHEGRVLVLEGVQQERDLRAPVGGHPDGDPRGVPEAARRPRDVRHLVDQQLHVVHRLRARLRAVRALRAPQPAGPVPRRPPRRRLGRHRRGGRRRDRGARGRRALEKVTVA